MLMRRARVAIFLSSVIPVLAAARSAQDGVYTKDQATRRQTVYREECAKCHAENLTGGDGSPELTGRDF
jgi:cytochrome c553